MDIIEFLPNICQDQILDHVLSGKASLKQTILGGKMASHFAQLKSGKSDPVEYKNILSFCDIQLLSMLINNVNTRMIDWSMFTQDLLLEFKTNYSLLLDFSNFKTVFGVLKSGKWQNDPMFFLELSIYCVRRVVDAGQLILLSRFIERSVDKVSIPYLLEQVYSTETVSILKQNLKHHPCWANVRSSTHALFFQNLDTSDVIQFLNLNASHYNYNSNLINFTRVDPHLERFVTKDNVIDLVPFTYKNYTLDYTHFVREDLEHFFISIVKKNKYYEAASKTVPYDYLGKYIPNFLVWAQSNQYLHSLANCNSMITGSFLSSEKAWNDWALFDRKDEVLNIYNNIECGSWKLASFIAIMNQPNHSIFNLDNIVEHLKHLELHSISKYNDIGQSRVLNSQTADFFFLRSDQVCRSLINDQFKISMEVCLSAVKNMSAVRINLLFMNILFFISLVPTSQFILQYFYTSFVRKIKNILFYFLDILEF